MMVSFSPRDVLDEILDLIESVSEGFPTYYSIGFARGWGTSHQLSLSTVVF